MKSQNTNINVAPTSNEGHFLSGSADVIPLELEQTESFIVKTSGACTLNTKRHYSNTIQEDCLINVQRVYNPFASMFEKSKD